MKAKDLASELMKHPEFDVKFSTLKPDGTKWGIKLCVFDVALGDIGYSDKTIILTPE